MLCLFYLNVHTRFITMYMNCFVRYDLHAQHNTGLFKSANDSTAAQSPLLANQPVVDSVSEHAALGIIFHDALGLFFAQTLELPHINAVQGVQDSLVNLDVWIPCLGLVAFLDGLVPLQSEIESGDARSVAVGIGGQDDTTVGQLFLSREEVHEMSHNGEVMGVYVLGLGVQVGGGSHDVVDCVECVHD